MRIYIIQVLCILMVVASGCNLAATTPGGRAPSGSAEARPNETATGSREGAEAYGRPVKLADLKDQTIRESSGIVASRRNQGLFWTHNDSGDGPFIHAFDRNGEKRGVWRVTGAEARDWEDIAIGPGPQQGLPYLYIGDIGTNDGPSDRVTVYRVAEPLISPADADSTKAKPLRTERAEAIRLRYPDGKYDAEALMVHPATGDLYILTKVVGAASGVYKLTAPFSESKVNTLTRVGEVLIPNLFGGMVTGGDISPDGRRVVLCDYLSAYVMRLPEGSGEFDEIWRQPLMTISLGPRQQGEAICYRLDGAALMATSEKRPTPLIEVSLSRK